CAIRSTPSLHCLALLPRPPSSTLFPYTTLFRSLGGVARDREGGLEVRQVALRLRSGDRGGIDAVDPRDHGPDLGRLIDVRDDLRSEEHTSELQSRENLVCRLLLEKKKRRTNDKP